MPQRTLRRYALEELGVGRSARASTVRVDDWEPGDELQVDLGELGRIPDPEMGRQRDLWALIFTPSCRDRWTPLLHPFLAIDREEFGSRLRIMPQTRQHVPLFQHEPLLGVGLATKALRQIAAIRAFGTGPATASAGLV